MLYHYIPREHAPRLMTLSLIFMLPALVNFWERGWAALLIRHVVRRNRIEYKASELFIQTLVSWNT
jgi:hypothetical protein